MIEETETKFTIYVKFLIIGKTEFDHKERDSPIQQRVTVIFKLSTDSLKWVTDLLRDIDNFSM